MPDPGNAWQGLKIILLPAIMLGLTTNLRVLGPIAGLLSGVYDLTLRETETCLVVLTLRNNCVLEHGCYLAISLVKSDWKIH